MAKTKKAGKTRYGGLTYMAAAAAAALLVLIAVLALNTSRLEAEPLADAPPAPPAVDGAAVQRLSQALRIATVSSQAGPPSEESLSAFAAHLESSFPRVHSQLRREQIGGGSLLYTWPGSDPNAPALLLAAHQDVVPIDSGTESNWSHPAFGGVVSNGFVWGRGALDDKASLMAILEAVERQLARGFRPRQTIYLAFGHDEEIGGSGARAMAAAVSQRAPRVGLALDEGMAVLDGVVAGVSRPVALVGVGEKGYVSAELIARGAGGHSSMPSPDNAAVRVARAVSRLSDQPMPARIDGITGEMLDAVAPYTEGVTRVALANRWLTGRFVRKELLESPSTAATIRTTTAPTIIQAGTKDNVLPQRARAVVNHRIMPGETIGSVLDRDREIIDDERVIVRALPGGHNPGRPASTDSPDFQRLREVIRATFPNAPVAPGLVVGATDGRHYQDVARTVLRFAPLTMSREDLSRFHGNDERIGIGDYMRAIAFYERLISSPPPLDN
jgi:carboxypeptidase PM20D1